MRVKWFSDSRISKTLSPSALLGHLMTHELPPLDRLGALCWCIGQPPAKREFDHYNQLWYSGVMSPWWLWWWGARSTWCESWGLRIRLTTVINQPPLCDQRRSIFSGALSGWIFMQITFVADALQQQCLYDLHHLAGRLRCYAWSLIAFDWFLIQSAPPISQLRYTACSPLTTSLVQIYFNFFPNIVGTPLLIVLIAAGLCFRKDELWIQARGNCNAEWKEMFQVLLAIFEKRSFKIENRFSTEWPI